MKLCLLIMSIFATYNIKKSIAYFEETEYNNYNLSETIKRSFNYEQQYKMDLEKGRK